jgi:SAM-dependent methyltransferase
MTIPNTARTSIKRVRSALGQLWYGYPKNVQCNLCEWQGRRFLSDSWHEHIKCPKCGSDVRQRLFIAAIQEIEGLSIQKLIKDKDVLHFAPESALSLLLRGNAARYVTADFLRTDCDFSLDMSDMPEMKDASFDAVIAFDVLEHVPDYRMAIHEVHRVLSRGGWGIFTVPQKDNLKATLEDPAIVTAEDRERNYGQWDHLRIFGADFSAVLERAGFKMEIVDESRFPMQLSRKNVLVPSALSKNPLATNYRKVFFAQKV